MKIKMSTKRKRRLKQIEASQHYCMDHMLGKETSLSSAMQALCYLTVLAKKAP